MISPENKCFGTGDPKLSRYAEQTFSPENPEFLEVRERAKQRGLPPIHVGPMDALHLEVLLLACGAKKVVELGALAGYSGLRILKTLPQDGMLYTFEYDKNFVAVVAETFEKYKVQNRARIFVGEALSQLPQIEKDGPFDVVFIDADKENYPAYLAWAEKNLRVGGLVIGDNTLAWGLIANDHIDDPTYARKVEALRKFNTSIAHNPRFKATLFPTGEGLTVGVKVR